MNAVPRVADLARPKPAERPSREDAENAIRTLLSYIGENPAREGLLDTPKRVIKAYAELFSGYAEDSEAVLDREAARIDMGRAAPFPLPRAAEGDTIWMGAIDGAGLAVSYIQSVFWEFGSGCVLPETGIHWHNRGMAFSLDPTSRNPLVPGRRPFHTLNPALAVFRDGRVAPYGAMGGEGQAQFQSQIFTRYADFGMSPAEAIDAPRWLLGRAWRAPAPTLKVEDRFDPALIRVLAGLGHDVEELGRPYANTLGHAGLLVRHPRGRIEAAHAHGHMASRERFDQRFCRRGNIARLDAVERDESSALTVSHARGSHRRSGCAAAIRLPPRR